MYRAIGLGLLLICSGCGRRPDVNTAQAEFIKLRPDAIVGNIELVEHEVANSTYKILFYTSGNDMPMQVYLTYNPDSRSWDMSKVEISKRALQVRP